MPGRDAYDLDGVANIESSNKMSEMPYPTHKGDTGLDDVHSVTTDAKLTYDPDDAFPTGPAVPLDAVTGLPMGEGAQKRYDGTTGHIKGWPKAYQD
jgi:hypothetical protein